MLLCCSRNFVATTWDCALIRHTVLMHWISTADLCMGTTVRSVPEIAMSQLHLVSHIDKVLLSQQGLCRSPDGRQCLGATIKQGLCSQHQAPGSQSHNNCTARVYSLVQCESRQRRQGRKNSELLIKSRQTWNHILLRKAKRTKCSIQLLANPSMHMLRKKLSLRMRM